MGRWSERDDDLDDVLMRRFTAGDLRAFEELYARWERPLFGFLLRLLPDEEVAADVFQEVWFRVLEARDRYGARGRFRSWLFTIARRLCVDRARSGEREERTEAGYTTEQGRTNAVSLPERRVSAAAEIDRLLDGLPSGQREVLLLSKYHGFTYGEIAAMTGSTEAAVKQKVYRALRSLRGER